MPTMAEISAAINQIEFKKQNLHKSFLHLQSQSPSSFNLPLNWPDLDSYFTTLNSSLQSKFNLLQTLPPSSDPLTVPARPELKSFCQNSDGLGLNRFIALAPDRLLILSELPDAYRYAPDAPAMVLHAMVSFYSPELKGAELLSFRSGCSIMLDGLVRVKPDIKIELKDKAMEMAVQWNQIRVSSPGYVIAKEQEALGFLLLAGAYGLVDRFSIDEIIDCFLVVAKRRQAVDLCRRIIPPNNRNDVIQKLIDEDMHVTAVNFSIELEKTDEFPPVGLLEERKLRSMMVIEETRRNVKDLHVCNAVIMKETGALKAIIKCVNENHLESVYPTDSLVEVVNELENEVENSKPTVLKKPKLNEVQPTAESALVTPVQNVESIQESHSQKSDLSPDHVGGCHSSPLGSGPSGSNAPSAKDSVVEVVKELQNELENNKQPRVNDLGLRKQPLRATVLKLQLRSRPKMLKKRNLNEVQPTAEYAVVTPTQKESHSQKSPDHVGECHISPLGSDPSCSVVPSAKDSVVELVNKLGNEVENSTQTLVNDLGSTKQPARVTLLEKLKLKEVQPTADSAKDSVNKLQIELENSKQTRVNDLRLRKQPPRATVLKQQQLSKSKMLKMSKKRNLNKVQPTAEYAVVTPTQKESLSQKSPDHVGECHISPLGSGPSGSVVPSAKDSVAELVNKLGNEVENSKQTLVNDPGTTKQPARATLLEKLKEGQPTAESAKDSVHKLQNELENNKQTRVNDLGLRKQPLRATVLKQQQLSKSKMSKMSKKQNLNKVQPTAENAVVTPTQKESLHVGECHISPLGSSPSGSAVPSAKDSVAEPVNKLGNEVENSKQTLVNDPGSIKQPARVTLLKKLKLKEVQPTAESGKDSVNKLQNELENSKQTRVNDLGLRKPPLRVTVLKQQRLGLRKQSLRATVLKQQHLGLRKQPLRATVLKQQLLSKSKMSKKPKLNKAQPAAEFAVATPTQKESHSQKSSDHVGECHISPPGSGPSDSVAPLTKDNVVELVNELGNEVENDEQTPVNNLGLRKQPPSSTVLNKSKKPKLNEVEPTAEPAAATPIQNVKLIQECHSHRSDLSPNHGGDCHSSPPGSGPTGSNAPSIGSTRVDIDYSFFVPQLHPPACNSNGWISD